MKFYKYQGAGNDFVILDNRQATFPKNTNLIHKICDRRFGIGADGLMLLENINGYDFRMVYYNADGNESTMCGNGGRCIVAFANYLNIFDNTVKFMAIDGEHEAEIKGQTVNLKMSDVKNIFNINNDFELNTGSPHYIKYVDRVENFNVFEEGRAIRNSEKYIKEGINVNFVSQLSEDEIFVRTYERGVEDETYSCGTGVTAAALTFMQKNNLNFVKIKTLGGNLTVSAEKAEEGYHNIWLEGPAVQVFEGEITIENN